MTRAQIAVILALCALLLVGVAGPMIRDRCGGPRLEVLMSSGALPPYGVNINTAEAAELAVLPGIGPARAQRIVSYRQAHGPFATVEDLARVPGLSARIIAELAPYAVAE
jgi:competence ComEA-like helix-hairpin-helix protein